jgi:hypothetical protein
LWIKRLRHKLTIVLPALVVLDAQEGDAHMKWKRKIITGLEKLTKYAAKHSKAQAALAELAKHVRHPFDPSESNQKKSVTFVKLGDGICKNPP